ncbi:MAG: D-tyrosyl-tRNA(Tyr) deacylase [Halobacteriovoraceae bacterium]|nr:D-tyrosyl-tRNA(Tyr) deacylase [Halobacteriovoraceae bacterium]
MKVVVQRSKHSKVLVDERITGQIDKGLVLLVCFEQGDNIEKVETCVEKLLKLRIFDDSDGKMNLNVEQINGKILAISQFTLSWDGRRGNRPSFDLSMSPQEAKVLFGIFCQKMSQKVPVQTGVFGEVMDVQISNDGPVTFHLSY